MVYEEEVLGHGGRGVSCLGWVMRGGGWEGGGDGWDGLPGVGGLRKRGGGGRDGGFWWCLVGEWEDGGKD